MSRIHTSGKNVNSRLIKALKRIVLVLIALLLVMAVAVVGTFEFLKYQGKKSALPDVKQNSNYVEIIEYDGKRYKYNENIFSVAFLGVDREEFLSADETDFVGASDAMMVITVDVKTGDARVIALPRDIMVQMDTFVDGSDEIRREEEHQLYLAYSYGDGGELSCQNAVDAISRVLYNVTIQKYYALDLSGITALNDAIGGVVLKSKYDFPQYDIKTGDVVTLKGDMAESYVRSRDTDTITASLDRLDRQVQYVESFVSQITPAVLVDFSKVSQLYNIGSEYSQTNLSASDAAYLASLLISKGTFNFETYTIDGEMKGYDDETLDDTVHAAFYPDEESVMQTVLDVFYTRIG